MVDKSRALTLLEIIAIDWRKQGGKSKWPTKAFIATWRAAIQPIRSGVFRRSSLPHSPRSRCDRGQSWIVQRGPGSRPGIARRSNPASPKFAESYRDIYDQLDQVSDVP